MLRSLLGTTALACGVALSAAISPAQAFRIEPYLQQPSETGMLINWFTETGEAGLLTVTGPGLPAPLQLTSTPEFQPLLSYTQVELDQGAAGEIPLFANSNYKHSIAVDGLQPNSTYTYAVSQGGTSFDASFRTAPTRDDWNQVRFIALADSETEPQGRTRNRLWFPGNQATGSLGRPASLPPAMNDGPSSPFVDGYLVTETEGFNQNLRIIEQRDPDFIVFPGDIVQGGGYQPGWDEFFRHTAGEFTNVLSERPILPAYGNWENFGAANGGYTIDPDTGENWPMVSREKYKVYFDAPSNGTPEHQDNYYRVDYGPVTIITIDSSNGEPDLNFSQAGTPGLADTDTQFNFSRQQYESVESVPNPSALSDFNPGSTQWNWVLDQLQDARDDGQVIFVQFHHVAYSTGFHSLPADDPRTSGQSGTPLRQYQEFFEEFGVAAVLSGHNEQFERSFVDLDGDGIGVHHYDVGMAGDGFGVPFSNPLFDSIPGFEDIDINQVNPFRSWTADIEEGELWLEVTDENGETFVTLVDGGKHYGHLEIELVKLPDDHAFQALLTLTPVYSFPILDADFQAVGDTERRVYGDVIRLFIDDNGAAFQVAAPAGAFVFAAGLLGLFGLGRRRRRG